MGTTGRDMLARYMAARGSDGVLRLSTTPPPTDRRPLLEPVPVPGCDVCGALGRQRETALAAGDQETVETCNAEIANHPHRRGAQR